MPGRKPCDEPERNREAKHPIEAHVLERMLCLELHEACEGFETDNEQELGAQRVEEESRGSGHQAVRPSSRVTPA